MNSRILAHVWQLTAKGQILVPITGLGFLLLAIVCFSSCTRQSGFAERITDANRVTVVKRTAPNVAVSISLEGEEARRIVRALSSAQARESNVPPPATALRIEFLKGTNRLAVLNALEGLFWADGKQFEDGTGALLALEGTPPEQWKVISYEAYQALRGLH